MAKQKAPKLQSFKIWAIFGLGLLLLVCVFLYFKFTSTPTSYLFVQNAASAEIIKKDDSTYLLTLNEVSPSTVYFSNRPRRIAGLMDTEDFVNFWTIGEDNFQTDPPNASLVSAVYIKDVDGIEVEEDIIIVLSHPQYEASVGTLTYTIQPIADNVHLPTGTFKNVSLFIDGILISKPDRPNGGIEQRFQ